MWYFFTIFCLCLHLSRYYANKDPNEYGNYVYSLNLFEPVASTGAVFVGDTNGDRIPDMLIGFNDKVRLVFGENNHFSSTKEIVDRPGYYLFDGTEDGFSFSPAGDFNNDGLQDYFIRNEDSDKAFLIFGKSDIIDIDLSNFPSSAGIVIEADFRMVDLDTMDIGDFDGDSISDILLTPFSWPENGIYRSVMMSILLGSNSPPSTVVINSTSSALRSFTLELTNFDAAMVVSAYIGDINGDGFSDIMISLPTIKEFYILLGRSSFPNRISFPTALAENYLIPILAEAGTSNFAYFFAAAGDVNNDGFDDFLISSARAVYVVLGSNKIPAILDLAKVFEDVKVARITYPLTHTRPYFDVVGKYGDFDGDGFDDILVSLPRAGYLYLIYGAKDFSDINLGMLGPEEGALIQGNPMKAMLESFSSGYDFDADGKNDILIASSKGDIKSVVQYVSGKELESELYKDIHIEFGSEIDSKLVRHFRAIGDINGDGLADLLGFAARYLEDENNQDFNRIAYIIYGQRGIDLISNGNLSLSSFSTTSIHIQDATRETTYEHSVEAAALGDINDDGFNDFVILSLISHRTNVAYIILGGTKILSSLCLQQLDGIGFSILVPSPYFIESVTTAGDFNGDEIQDLKILLKTEEYSYDAVILFGNPLLPTFLTIDLPDIHHPDSSKAHENQIIHPVCLNSFRQASIGDINTDGYDDLLCLIDENRIVLICGSDDYSNPAHQVEIYQANKTSSYSIIGSLEPVGDVNNDHYPDFAIGIQNNFISGFVYLYFGQKDILHTPLKRILLKAADNVGFGVHMSYMNDLHYHPNNHHAHPGSSDILLSTLGKVYIIHGRENMADLPFIDVPIDGGVAISCSSISDVEVVGDFDGDSLPELIISSTILPGSLLIDDERSRRKSITSIPTYLPSFMPSPAQKNDSNIIEGDTNFHLSMNGVMIILLEICFFILCYVIVSIWIGNRQAITAAMEEFRRMGNKISTEVTRSSQPRDTQGQYELVGMEEAEDS